MISEIQTLINVLFQSLMFSNFFQTLMFSETVTHMAFQFSGLKQLCSIPLSCCELF